jgi:hypothetical protein
LVGSTIISTHESMGKMVTFVCMQICIWFEVIWLIF